MFLFFDTETSDLPKNWRAPETDTKNWPRLVQLAWISADASGNVAPSVVHLIKPKGFSIAAGAFEQHGISTQFAANNGTELFPVLESFLAAVNQAEVIVAHNIDFDLNIMGAECVRAKLQNPMRKKKLRCTMKESANYCRIRGKQGFKWPTLTELYSRLFQSEFEGAHDAAADCLACMKCFFRLRELKAIP